MVPNSLHDRHGRLDLHLPLQLRDPLVVRGVLQLQAHIKPDQPQRQGKGEWNAPAPRIKLVRGKRRSEEEHDGRGGGGPQSNRCGLPGPVSAALVLGGIFHNERRRPAELPARGEALQRADDHQKERRPEPNLIIGRQQGDRRGAHRHQEHHRGKDVAAAGNIAKVAQDEGAERPGHERNAKCGKSGQQRHVGITLGKEHPGQDRRGCAIQDEIIPFDKVADRTRDDGSFGNGVLGTPNRGRIVEPIHRCCCF